MYPADWTNMPEQKVTVGEVIAAFLERCGVSTSFGVISIHNMPILDAFHRRGKMRFVPARSEAGALNIQDLTSKRQDCLSFGITSGLGRATG